jgi:hypothetical protein
VGAGPNLWNLNRSGVSDYKKTRCHISSYNRVADYTGVYTHGISLYVDGFICVFCGTVHLVCRVA